MEEQLDTVMMNIIEAIRQAGYEPYDQLTAYLLTRDDRYITRNGNARRRIKEVEWGKLTMFVRGMR